MPTTRSTSATGKTTTTDWSMNTPEDTETDVTSRSTLTRRTPPPPSPEDETADRAAGDLTAPAPPYRAIGERSASARPDRAAEKCTRPLSPKCAAHGDRVAEGGRLARAAPPQPPVLVERGQVSASRSGTAAVRAESPALRVTRSMANDPELLARITEAEERRTLRKIDIEQSAKDLRQSAGLKEKRFIKNLKPDTQSIRSSKRAAIEAKMQIAKRELEVAEARSKIAQAELELLQLDSDEEDFGDEQGHQDQIEQWLDRAAPIYKTAAPPPPTPPPEEERKSELKELAQIITKMSQRSTEHSISKHMIELPNFNGASEEWLAFKRSFEDTERSFSPTQNLARLRRALQGKARDAVKSLLFTAETPQEVVKGLEARFGRPGAIALAELEKLKNLQKISESPSDICAFTSHMRNCVATIKALGKSQYLSSPETTKSLLERMPSNMRYRWFIYHRSRKEEEKPELILINDFLEIEADMCGDFAPPEVSWETKRTTVKRSVNAVQETEAQPQTRKAECPECQGEHWIYECKAFKEGSMDNKWKIVKKARLCFKCLRYRHSRRTCRAPTCKKCTRWHHTSLHSDVPPATTKDQVEKSTCNALKCEKSTDIVISSVHTSTHGKAYLKVIPVDLYGPKGSVRVLALMDEGSTVTLLDSSIAKKIGAKGTTEPITIETIGGNAFKKGDSQRLKIKIKGAHRRDKRTIEVRTIDELRLAQQEVENEIIRRCEHLQPLKDQLVFQREEPRLLIGQDNWGLIITRKLKKGKKSEPVASLTSLGWVLHGCELGSNTPVNFVNHSHLVEDETDALVRRHFDIECMGVMPNRPSNDADKRAMDILEKTTKRLPDGKLETGLLWRSEEETLPNNYQQAYKRLIKIEKKLDKDPKLKISYEEQMNQLLEKNYAEKAPAETKPGKTFYLPHFAVVHPIKKKSRIVLDAAAKFQGKSLNDALLPGPDLLQSLFGVLIRFREGPVAVVADVKEMFLRIQMREEDRDSLRFLWRGSDRKRKPEEYRMKSVIFGAASSPSTAIFVMNKNAEDFKDEYPEAVKAIKSNHYMDDYLQSFSTVEEAEKTAKEVQLIHAKAGFHLKDWGSNKSEVLKNIQDESKESVKEFSLEEKTLGLRWLINEDTLAFNVGFRNTPPTILSGEKTPTKREVTSAVMSTFDPMGFAAPVLIQGKKLIQDIWRSKIDWDEKILPKEEDTWKRYLQQVNILKDLKIPRCLSPHHREGELHTFTDASEEAYAAAVYWKTVEHDVHITLIAGKAQVTPTKPTSIPRLELQAALLGSRLASTIEKEMNLVIMKKTFWTDSSTVLQWLKSDPRKFKTFVAHRLAAIEELTSPRDWRWVPTKQNPADDATRGTPREFDHTARWFKGPTFLYEDEESWPNKRFTTETTETGEEKNNQIVTLISEAPQNTPDPERFSSWTRLLRSTARVFQFMDILKRRCQEKKHVHVAKDDEWKLHKRAIKKKVKTTLRPSKPEKLFEPLENIHYRRAKEELIKRSQKESFAKEVDCLKNNKCLVNSSRLRKIDVYINSENIIKLRTRTNKIQIENQEKNPIVLDGRNSVCRLIIDHYHRKFFHGNTETVVNELRQKYWILRLRTTTKGVLHKCQWCKVHKGIPQIPPLGNHPIERLQHHQHPFTCAAVDNFGPMQVSIGRRIEKRWGVLFTCLTTRAVHLELSNSLSTSSMIMALRRMAARRGTPKVLFSDNGTNFIGANRELEEAAAKENIRWKFIPPGSPNMGGAWERMVRTVKTVLIVVLQTRTPPEEVLHTLLVEVEHIVNSRPLTHISMDPNDEESLTPNHFLLGRSCGAASPGEFEDRDLIGKANWRTVQRLTDHFWQRWIKEYLPTLKPRTISGRSSDDPQVGDIVLIVDTSSPRNTWPRGEVLKIYPGPDGRVRILDVRTPGGILRRSTRRVVVLVPVTTSQPQDGELRTAGENVSDDL